MDLPLWLQTNSPPAPSPSTKVKQSNFIQKTLQGIIHFVRESVYSEEIALRPGFLQALDPRMKLLAIFSLLITVNLLRHLPLLWGIYLGILILAMLSKVPSRFLIQRVWFVIPLFTGIMVLPSIFNWVRPGDPLWMLWTFSTPHHLGPIHFPPELTITRQGFWGAILLISRVGISVTLAVLLTLTTRWNNLLRALRTFFVPKIFIVTLEMTYRYIFVLITLLEDMFLARKARDAGRSSGSEQRRFVGSSIAHLFGKSLQMSEEVYTSMVARGYTGEIFTLQRFQLRWVDIFSAGVSLMACLTLYAADKVLGG
ncbi:cobalt ECF transporter T component CbiQ [Desulfosporosinus metallidurans]|uniref:Transmembrane component NikQ of energizing module of nickel ECF transporter n=1 Tax=Desulfosporosinus metallidurans TaxID=1888891 RepID=A0A1Q8R0H3_9FIRM|nr:cobalt ECF transporter T component CbiQ [Desulfosporosinus metallidurans]OLN33129.1 Transmembrane component NikQ of energizing module of nickel ECF transporter [Desulfosporosinus metallidurans]